MQLRCTLALLAVLALSVAEPSFARSPRPIATKPGPNGRPIPAQPSVYMFVGEVIGQSTFKARSSSGEKIVSAIGVRVVESQNLNTSPGKVHYIRKSFEGEPLSLTIEDFPVGARVQVYANQEVPTGDPISIQSWEMKIRLFRVD